MSLFNPPGLTPPGLLRRVSGPPFAVLDVETTGLDAQRHRVLEIAVVTVDPTLRITGEWSTRLNPGGPVGATHIHGITEADVADAPPFAAVAPHLARMLSGSAIAAHHAAFDLAFLRAELRRAGWDVPFLPAVCTLEASRHCLPYLDRRRLVDCCEACGVPLTNAHSALGDARATAAVLAAFLAGSAMPAALLHRAAECAGLRWPSGPTLEPQAYSAPPAAPRWQRVAPKPAASPLVESVKAFSLADAVDEGAPEGSIAYLETLAVALEDGVITDEEATDLAAVSAVEGLSNSDVDAAHRAFVLTLALAAVDDGRVTQAERRELQTVSDLLGVDQRLIPSLLDRAERARETRMSADLKALPDDWDGGEPLRVGDKVAFTGCDDAERAALERRAESLGVRVMSAVSGKTVLLVSDGSVEGTKRAKATELGTRTVTPGHFAELLNHLQPALPRRAKAQPRPTQTITGRHTAR